MGFFFHEKNVSCGLRNEPFFFGEISTWCERVWGDENEKNSPFI